jgi:hypothetical protein
MNTYAVPPRTMLHSSSSSSGSSAESAATTLPRPRRIADLLVVRGNPPAGEETSDARGAHSSSHWVALARDPHEGERAPAHVKALALELGVDTTVAWNVLDGMYA